MSFTWWLKTVTRRSKIAFFSKWAAFKDLFPKNKNDYIFDLKQKLSKLHKKIFCMTVTITFLLTKGQTRASNGPITLPLRKWTQTIGTKFVSFKLFLQNPTSSRLFTNTGSGFLYQVPEIHKHLGLRWFLYFGKWWILPKL